jgi:hypothetical protein
MKINRCQSHLTRTSSDNKKVGVEMIEVGDYVEIDIGGGWYVDGIVDHVPCKISDCWIIIEEDGLPRYCYDPPSLKLVRKGEKS